MSWSPLQEGETYEKVDISPFLDLVSSAPTLRSKDSVRPSSLSCLFRLLLWVPLSIYWNYNLLIDRIRRRDFHYKKQKLMNRVRSRRFLIWSRVFGETLLPLFRSFLWIPLAIDRKYRSVDRSDWRSWSPLQGETYEYAEISPFLGLVLSAPTLRSKVSVRSFIPLFSSVCSFGILLRSCLLLCFSLIFSGTFHARNEGIMDQI